MTSHRRLPALEPPPAGTAPDVAAAALQQQRRRLPLARDGVAVARQVRYGPAARNYADIYVPLSELQPPAATAATAAGATATAGAATAATAASQGQGQAQAQGQAPLRPVVFFVHGGVWASGETWQYAPMATRLAQQGA